MLHWTGIREFVSAKAIKITNDFLSEVAKHNHEGVYEPVISDSGWLAVPYSAGYDNASTAEYRKIGGIVYFRGQFIRDSGNVTNADIMGTLPAGYRPTVTRACTGVGTGAYTAKVAINTAGEIMVNSVPTGSTTYLFLDQMQFTVD